MIVSAKNTDSYGAGIFVLPGPLDLEKLRPDGRGMPLGKDTQIEVRGAESMRDPVLAEIIARLQGVEEAMRQREEAFTKGINAFAEQIVSALLTEWQQSLEEQKKTQEEQEQKILAAVKLLLEQTVQAGEKPDSGQPVSWLGRLFDSRK